MQTITVSQLAWYIKKIFEAEELLYGISVVGEVSGLKIVRGIAYFDLKDSAALISCVAFDGAILSSIKNGDKIIATGTPGFYVKGGRLNFNVSKVQLDGQGDLFKAFLELKDRLQKDGLFDDSHKIPVPSSAQKIGVITSPTGAVLHDIINVATRRNPSINICLYPAKVQGDGTAESVIAGLDYFEQMPDIDVVIIARGGGSAEDLWEFNSEALARRIHAFKLPVVSAVGHETDFSICDFVSDVRAPTPSAAAELVVANILEKKHAYRRQVLILSSRLKSLLVENSRAITSAAQTLSFHATSRIKDWENRLALSRTQLEKFNPHKILALGYAKIEKQGQVITSAKALKQGDRVSIRLKDGTTEGEIL